MRRRLTSFNASSPAVPFGYSKQASDDQAMELVSLVPAGCAAKRVCFGAPLAKRTAIDGAALLAFNRFAVTTQRANYVLTALVESKSRLAAY